MQQEPSICPEDRVLKIMRGLIVIASVAALSACERSGDDNSVTDGGLDGGPLQDGVANIWVDPDGCQHWVIDDGLEGFMSPRLNRDGTPQCRDDRGGIVLKDGTFVAIEEEPELPS